VESITGVETYKPDVAGFRWNKEEEIEAVAVECKAATDAKGILSALSQATVYQLFSTRLISRVTLP
jgi:hypothetical protein